MKLRINEEDINDSLAVPSFINTEIISKIMNFIDIKSDNTSIKDFNMKLVYVYIDKPPNANITEDNLNEFYCKGLQGYLIYNVQNEKTDSFLNNKFGHTHYALQDQLSNNLKLTNINNNNIIFAIITWNTFDEEQDVSISYPYSTIIPRSIINNVTDSLVNLYKFIKSKYANKNENVMNKKLERMTFMKLRINEKETPNIEVKNKGILEVPEGKNVDDLPLSHFVTLANKKGLSKITKALNNLQVWNKNDDLKLSKWAGDMIDKLNKKLKKDESLGIKESSDKKSYWKYNPEDKAFYIDPDNYDYAKYYSRADIKKIKLFPCTYEEAKEIEQYSDDYAVVTTYDTDTIIYCTQEEAYDQLYTGANISLYEYYQDL